MENRVIDKYRKNSTVEDNEDYFSSVDNSQISDSDFGLIEGDEKIVNNIKKNKFIKK